VEPAIEGGFDEYPIDYRRGLIEGMLLTSGGSIGLTSFYASRFVSLVGSLPEPDARELLERLGAAVVGAPWLATWRGSTRVDPREVMAAMRSEGTRLALGLTPDFEVFCARLVTGIGDVDGPGGPM